MFHNYSLDKLKIMRLLIPLWSVWYLGSVVYLCLYTVHEVHIQLLHMGGVGLCPWLMKTVVLCPCFCFNVVLCPSDSFHAHFSAHFRAGVGLGNVTQRGK